MPQPDLVLPIGAALLGTGLGPGLARLGSAQIAVLEQRAAVREPGCELGEALRRTLSGKTAACPRWRLTYMVALAGACGGGALLGGAFLALAFGLAACAALLDLRGFWLPDSLTRPLLWLALLGAATGLAAVGPADAILGAAMAWALGAALRAGLHARHGQEMLGGGDAKLFVACGGLCGLSGLPLLLGALPLGLGLLGLARRGGPDSDWLPLGAAIVAAWMASATLALGWDGFAGFLPG